MPESQPRPAYTSADQADDPDPARRSDSIVDSWIWPGSGPITPGSSLLISATIWPLRSG